MKHAEQWERRSHTKTSPVAKQTQSRQWEERKVLMTKQVLMGTVHHREKTKSQKQVISGRGFYTCQTQNSKLPRLQQLENWNNTKKTRKVVQR